MMKFSKKAKQMTIYTSAITGICAVLVLGYQGMVLAMDNRYMTIQGGNELAVKVSNAARLKQIKHEMFIINYKIQDGSAKPLDRAILQQLKDEREELLQENK